MLNENILYLKSFTPYNEDKYQVIDIAWPVAIYECAANKKAVASLDALQEAVLKLINLKMTGDKEISNAMQISSDVIAFIKKILVFEEYISSEQRLHITEKGMKYLEGVKEEAYKDERLFGYMFVNLVDGDIMPYFHTEQLKFSSLKSSFIQSEIVLLEDLPQYRRSKDIIQMAPKFTEAYKKFCRIESSSAEFEDNNELEILQQGIFDVLYDEVDDEGNIETLEDKEKKTKIRNANVRVLGEEYKTGYVYTKMVVCKDNPEKFDILSPFPKNITTWYNKKLPYIRRKENNIHFELNDGAKILADDYLDEISYRFYAKFPELKEKDFNYYMKSEFPNLKRVAWLERNLINQFQVYYNNICLHDSGENDMENVVERGYSLLETIANNYISLIKNRRDICISKIVNTEDKVRNMFATFGISNCIACNKNMPNKLLDMQSRWQKGRVGDSIVHRYYFLTLEAYLFANNPFAKILYDKSKSEKLIQAIDYVFDIRSTYGAHSDDVVAKKISEKEYGQFRKQLDYVLKVLINTLCEGEILNVQK